MNFQSVVEVNHDSPQLVSPFQGCWASAGRCFFPLGLAGRWLFLLDLAQLLFLPGQCWFVGLASGSPVSRVAPAGGATSVPVCIVPPSIGGASGPAHRVSLPCVPISGVLLLLLITSPPFPPSFPPLLPRVPPPLLLLQVLFFHPILPWQRMPLLFATLAWEVHPAPFTPLLCFFHQKMPVAACFFPHPGWAVFGQPHLWCPYLVLAIPFFQGLEQALWQGLVKHFPLARGVENTTR